MKYEQILALLSLDRAADEKARDVLDGLVPEFDEGFLSKLIKDRKVAVFGCGPSLKDDFENMRDGFGECVLVSVDGSVRLFREEGVIPQVHVTDLDGDVPATIWANENGAVTIVHAHGDNIDKVRDVVPKLSGTVYGTTQVEPTSKIRDFGGFTDGDRAVYLAEHFNPSEIILAGMDFGDEIGEYSGTYEPEKKAKKLKIGRILLEELMAETLTPIKKA
ncbi:MAG: 6-hydroxymethylpterin diphosphokinase MptE-like protein [Candidatus Altiarchaeota archaeon]